MSNYGDYMAGRRAVLKYLESHSIKSTLERYNPNHWIFDLRVLLTEDHPIPDYWQDSAWYWLDQDDLKQLLLTETFKV